MANSVQDYQLRVRAYNIIQMCCHYNTAYYKRTSPNTIVSPTVVAIAGTRTKYYIEYHGEQKCVSCFQITAHGYR